MSRDEAWRAEEVRRLYRNRPTRPWLRVGGLLILGLTVVAWSRPELRLDDFLSPRRLANLQRFLQELRPYPLQGKDFDLSIALGWGAEMLRSKGWQAAATTLALSVVAILLAALGSLPFTFSAARTLATPQPYVPDPRPARPWQRRSWRALVALSRIVLMFLRSLPEYIWAFLFLAVLGPSPWALILALALHNMGSLGKLNAEVVENLEATPLAALRTLGASRRQILLGGLLPLTLSRFLLYFFYRWESCVREATVLGMLGIVSLGYWIVDARARTHHDEMLFFVLLGATIVLLGDLLSALAREIVRRA